jgi:hypothetical protein
LLKVFQSAAVKCPATDVVAAGMLITGVKPPLDKTGPAAEVKGANQSVLYTLNQGITVVPKVSLLLNLLVKIEPVLTVPKSIVTIAVFISEETFAPTDLTQAPAAIYIPLFCDAVFFN